MRKTAVAAIITLLCVALLAGCGQQTATTQVQDGNPPQTIATAGRFFSDDAFNFEFIRVIGAAPFKGADIGECLQAAASIEEGDFESWYAGWYAVAERIRKVGDEAAAAGHMVSAREAWLRASNYYRAAEFYLHGNPSDPRILETWGKSRDCFAEAAATFDPPIEPVEIPYEDTTLPGYMYKVDASGQPRPTLIIMEGFDGTQEEICYTCALAAVERGYNVLTFEGPGQGAPLREQGLHFRPDWENVVIPVVDYALTRPEVDPQKMILEGISLGGYLAPRGAAFDHRLAGLVANGGVFFPFDAIMRGFYGKDGLPSSAASFIEFIKTDPDDFNEIMAEAMRESTNFRWFIEHGMYSFGVSTPAGLMLAYSEFSMEGLADGISCPTLVIDSEQDYAMQGQPQQLYDALTCPKDFLLFTTEQCAQYHCQTGAYLLSTQRIFDWLEEL